MTRSWRQPRYSGSASRSALFVPTSSTIGSVRSGRMPPISVYSESLPIGMPRPPAPWSPMPEDPLAVGDDDDVHLAVGAVPQRGADVVAMRVGDEQAARPAVDVAELLAALADHRRVDDRQHLDDVVEQQPVEEHLVGVLQVAQVDVPLEVVVLPPVGLVGADHLLVQRLDLRRQQAVQAEAPALLLA